MLDRIKTAFRKDGYYIVRNALEKSEVNELREYFNQKFSRHSFEKGGFHNLIHCSDIVNDQTIFKNAFNPKIVDALKSIFGPNYTMVQDFELQKNVMGKWHFDAKSEQKSPHIYKNDYMFAKCGLYFQDNTEEWGGGINIVPGYHRCPYLLPPISFLGETVQKIVFHYNAFARKIYNKKGVEEKSLILDLKAGDFVVFDSRLPHTSTAANNVKDVADWPLEHTKYVLYWNSTNQKYAPSFLDNSIERVKKGGNGLQSKLMLYDNFMFYDYLRLYYPDDYPENFVNALESQGLKLSSLGKDQTQEWKNLYQKVVEEISSSSSI